MRTIKFLLLVTWFLNISVAQTSRLINYQGYLMDHEGNPLEESVSIEFLIYYSESGGLPVWSETQNIPVDEGNFTTLLGAVSPIPAEMFDTDGAWLAIKVGGDAEMSPRQRITAVAYAFKADNADQLDGKEADDFVAKGSSGSISEGMIVDNGVTLRKIEPRVLSSIDGVYNDGGDVDLIAGDNINIMANNSSKTITISANVSGSGGLIGTDDIEDNAITLSKIEPTILSGLDGVSIDGGQIDLVAGDNVTITPDDANNRITISSAGGGIGDNFGNHTATQNIRTNGHWISEDGENEGVYIKSDGKVGVKTNNPTETLEVNGTIKATKVNADQSDNFVLKGETNSITGTMITDNSVSMADIQPSIVSTLDGVANDGGNIDLVAGDNITITPNDAQNKITISATGGGGTADNLGNHTATQNIQTNGHWLSGDGYNEGIFVTDIGYVGINSNEPVNELFVNGTIRAEDIHRGLTVIVSDPDSRGVFSKSQGSHGSGIYGEAEGSYAAGVKGVATENYLLSGNYGGYFQSSGGSGVAVYGYNDYSGPNSNSYGGKFIAHGENSKAVYGSAEYSESSDMKNYGGYFQSAGRNGIGTRGLATYSGDGPTYGGYFASLAAHGIGVYGLASSTSNSLSPNYGGYFESTKSWGIGAYGESSGSNGTGVVGQSVGSDGFGVGGSATGENGIGVSGSALNQDGVGIRGTSYGNSGRGVYGKALSYSGYTFGGYFEAESDDGRGVYGYASGSRGVGVFGSSGYYAGMFTGDVGIFGTLSKTAGSFKIDHPDDPENMYLQHSFVESPDMMNVYNGNVILDRNGEAVVELPDYFESLNIDFRYQLTAIGAPGPNLYIAEEISNNQFKIAGGSAGMKISWMVTGIRNDEYARNHRIEVEVPKEGKDQGKYLFPKEHNRPESMGIHYEEQQQLLKQQE
ncbi:MAG: hypothetical protein JXQ65_07230, partial [Candidatus Marinimicrobia bacterium]|nr:hypothetical protein [Candidatus Neomarinimicrobiota bacterium]